MDNCNNLISRRFFDDISSIITTGQHQAYAAAGQAAIATYWNIGRRIVEEEQQGEVRAKYGSKLISELAQRLLQFMGTITINVIYSTTANSIFYSPILKKCTSSYTI